MDTVTLPKLGQTMEVATIEKWHVAEGDEVKKGDILLEITTDKATLEVESYVAGTVRKILVAEGEEKSVGTIIVLIGTPEETVPDISTLETEAAPAPAEAKVPAPAAPVPTGKAPAREKEGRVRATPRAKKLARKLGVDLTGIMGSGPGGRITENDVKSHKGSGDGAAPAGDLERKPLSAMRRVIAENMTRSSNEAPHFYLTMDVDMTFAVELRAELKGTTGVGYNDMIVKACATAISEMPEINVTWLGDAVGLRKSIDIGLAVSLDEGLIVPVVRGADGKSLENISVESRALIEKARAKKLTPDEYGNGSMTISNLGMLGIDNFIPVINPGESVILGVGRIVEKAVVADGQIIVRSMTTMTLSCDHRVVDGALGAAFLGRVRELLEKPGSLTPR